MTDEPKTDATGNDAKPTKEKRTNRPKPVMEPETIGVAQLGQMAGDYDRAHPSRNDYYGVPACKWRKDGKPLRFDKSVAKAILTKRDLKAAGEQSDAPVASESTTTDPLPQGAPASDLPFRYQPGSAVRAGRRVSPGFENTTLDEFDRNEEELRRRGYLYDTDDNY